MSFLIKLGFFRRKLFLDRILLLSSNFWDGFDFFGLDLSLGSGGLKNFSVSLDSLNLMSGIAFIVEILRFGAYGLPKN
jgi:hypothetical protein